MRPVTPLLVVVLLGCAPVHRIVLERDYGWSDQDYRLELTSAGDATFERLKTHEVHRSTFDRRHFKELEAELERMRFAEYDAHCNVMAIDANIATVTWSRGAQVKTVADPMCPESAGRLMLWRLQNAIDRVGNAKRWASSVYKPSPETLISYRRMTERTVAHVLICRDGRVSVMDSRLAFVGRVQFQLELEELAHITAIVAASEQSSLFGEREEIMELYGPQAIHRNDRIAELEALTERWRQAPEVRLVPRSRDRHDWGPAVARPWPTPQGPPATITPSELWPLVSLESTEVHGHAVLEGYRVLDVLAGVDAPRDRCTR